MHLVFFGRLESALRECLVSTLYGVTLYGVVCMYKYAFKFVRFVTAV
jgi:hypothetical protein